MVVKEFLEDIEDKHTREIAGRIWKWTKAGLAGIVLTVGAWQSLYTVPSDSVGVVQRFGKFARQENPGLHLKFPYWIESVTKVPVKAVQTEEFGFRTLNGNFVGFNEVDAQSDDDVEEMIKASRSEARGNKKQQLKDIIRGEYLALTGDLNMADTEWVIQYNIKDAEAYTFNVRDPQGTLRDCSLSVMKQLTGNRSVDEVTAIGREEYANASRVDLQKLLDNCHTGINVITVKIQSSQAPEAVRESFNRVSKAMQQKEQKINAAMQDYNKEVPQATGQAQGIVEAARGYASETVNKAKGDVLKFEQRRREYANNPVVTRMRIYYDAIEKFLASADSVRVIEQKGAEGGILPIYANEGGKK